MIEKKVENNMGSEVKVTSCSKDKGFMIECFYDRLHFNLQIINGFTGLDFEADNPKMNAELRVMMAEL